MAEPLPSYNPDEPAHAQENDWDCMVESIEWALYAWGRTPSDDWLEQSMMAAGVVDPAVGCTDASGGLTAAWVNAEYGEYGYVAENETGVTFDMVAAEAAEKLHPLAMNGAHWYHWSGVRGYDPISDLLLLANPADGWQGVYQTMNRAQWAGLGPWNMVRVTHPEAEGGAAPSPAPPLDLSWWEDDGKVGSGLLDMMRADNVRPAQDYSTWLPIGRMPAQIEECIAEDGCVYRWLLTVSRGHRYRPTG